MDYSKTTVFDVRELRQELILTIVSEVMDALEFKGYNATNQMVGYLITGDINYITTFNNSRKKIARFDRSEVLMSIINAYMEKL